MKTIRNICFAAMLLGLAACQPKGQPELKPAYCPSAITIGMPQAQEQLVYIDETGSAVLPLLVNETVQMSCTLEPDSVTHKDVIWASSNEEVVSITQDGLITAVAEGTTGFSVISVTPVGMYSGSGVSATLKVRVSAQLVKATSMTLAATVDTIYVGECSTLTPTILPENATYRTVAWSSEDESIATVDEKGVVTGVNVPEGVSTEVNIVATALDGSNVTASYKMVVLRVVDPEQITLDPKFSKDNYACCMSEKFVKLAYTTVPAQSTQSRISWSCDKPEIATVDGGVVTFNQEGNFGEFTITATLPNGNSHSLVMNLPAGLVRELFDDPNNITWHDAGQSGNETETSYKWNSNGTITITTYSQNATKQRADIKCYATPIYICPANYPIFAIKMDDVKDKYAADGVTKRNINFDTSGNDLADDAKFSGNVGGSNNKYAYDFKCSDGSHVFIYDLATQSFATGGLFPADHIGKFGTFQFKHADIEAIDHQITFDLYWIQSFKSLDDLKAYLTAEGLTWDE